MKTRKPPRWVAAFLAALERGGDVRRAALEVGVDHSSAYNRRKTHADFAEGWAEALRLHSQRVEEEQRMEVPSPGSLPASPPSPAGGEGHLVLQPGISGARAARAGAGRWSVAAEKRFFAALADRANVRAAAEAAGFSTTAIYARRLKRPAFRRMWEAAVETGKARLQMLLIDHAERAFDPALLDVSEDAPRVSVAEALNILKSREGKDRELRGRSGGWGSTGGWDDEEGEFEEEEADELRDKLGRKLERILDQGDDKRIALGWTRHGDDLIPPGWVAGPALPAPDPET
jgi:hypothetical protein